MKVGLADQETIIIFNRADDKAYVFTYEPTWKRRMEELGCKCVTDNGDGGKEYEIDKKRIPLPRAKRRVSEAQRAAMTQRLQKARKAKKST